VASQLEEHAEGVIELLAKVTEFLEAFQRLVYREPEPEPELEPELELEPDLEPSPTAAPTALDPDAPLVEGSYQLALLMRKLQAFERLIEQDKLPRAALVADDINQTIQSFDPTLYFPRLFASFMRLAAVHSEALSECEEMRETPDWRALQEFFKVDLDGFVDL
jgi:hypothetical protein